MIFQYLKQRQLQDAIGEQNFDRFESLFPVLLGTEHDPTQLYKKANLIKLFTAFAPAGLFKKRQFMETLLNQLPPEKLHELCVATDTAVDADSFGKKVDLLLKRGWSDVGFCHKFLECAGLPDHFLPPRLERSVHEEVHKGADFPYKILKDYQFCAFMDCMSELAKERSRFVLQMPTGSGKTRTIMEILAYFLNQRSEQTIIVWLAHSQELCEQSMACFNEVWSHVGRKPVRMIRSYGGYVSLPYDAAEDSFVVASFQGLYSMLRKTTVPFSESRGQIGLVVVDEAHKVIAPTYKQVTKELIGPDTHVIGLTATPGRSIDQFKENQELADFFFGKIVSLRPPPGESVISWLRRKEVLSHHRFEPLITNITYELTAKQRKHLETLYDFPSGFLLQVAGDDVRNLEIIRRLEKELRGGGKILFFACSVEHSRFVCSVLLFLGYAAAHIDGSTDAALRSQYIADFKEARIQVLCNFGVLSTGFDAPKTDTVFISRPTASIVLYSQMLGRGLRGPAIGGTAECKIINVRDNIVGFSDQDQLYEYFDDYWYD